MEFKGTKGEWVYEGGDNNSIDIILPDDTTVSVDRHSRCSDVFVLSRKGMQANAKLIAAAPDLLKALQDVLLRNFDDYSMFQAINAINKALK